MKTTTHTNTDQKTFALENRILQLEIDRQGRITRRTRPVRKGEGLLENTLLSALYPQARVATVNVPHQMDMHEESCVHETLAGFDYQGVRYALAGASGSAKEGKFYFVDKETARLIARRFHNWPEAAMVYVGILVSPCATMIELADARVLIVPDHTLGTNDCSGWASHSFASKLHIHEAHLHQFRIALESTQGKGTLKIMDDAVAAALDADIILPESAMKPSLKTEEGDSEWLQGLKKIVPLARSIFNPSAKAEQSTRTPLQLRCFKGSIRESFSICGPDRRFRGKVILGIRESSQERLFNGSYQLTQFAPQEAIEGEILNESLAAREKLTKAIDRGDYSELMDLIGGAPDVVSPIGLETETADDSELDIVRALLLADASDEGLMIKYPYVRKRLNELLAKWYFKLRTGGGYKIPAYMLSHDGYLTVVDGTVYSGSDWIPKTRAVMAGDSNRGLVARYPIRMFEDLLPVKNLSDTQLRKMLRARFGKQHCNISDAVLEELIKKQIRLEGTLTLHSATAEENGGDFDGDWTGLLSGNRFPILVASRFNLKTPFRQTKTKHAKKKSNTLNTEAVALAAVGNHIGPITVLITRCIAAGRPDLAYQLVEQLQHALDSLKHGVKPDLGLVRDIRKQVKDYAPWLAFKNVRKVSDLPDYLEVAETDRIGQLYNLLGGHLGETFTSETKIKDFKGLILHSTPTREMLRECSQMNGLYAAVIGSISKRTEPISRTLQKAERELQAALKAVQDNPSTENKEAVRQKREAKLRVEADLTVHRERTKEEMKNIIAHVQLWAKAKTTNRDAWCQALHRVVCQGEGNGSILVFAFPQELVNKVAERTGGKALPVHVDDVCDGVVFTDEDGRHFLIEPIKTGGNHSGQKRSYLFTVRNGQFEVEDILDENLTPEQVAQLLARTPTEFSNGEKNAASETTASAISDTKAPEREDITFNPAAWDDNAADDQYLDSDHLAEETTPQMAESQR